MKVKNEFWDEIEHANIRANHLDVPYTTYENDIDMLQRSAEVVSIMPPTYLKDYTTQIMDVIEQLQEAIGVKND